MSSSNFNSFHKNPSRKSCEQIIKNILNREYEEYGENHHFKQASDFMLYFESLHPASPSLTKQVQRAVNSLNLPRDENGYFIIHKSAEEYQAEQELSTLLKQSSISDLSSCKPILIQTESWKSKHIIYLLKKMSEFEKLHETIAETDNGILIYTKYPQDLSALLSGLTTEATEPAVTTESAYEQPSDSTVLPE